MDFECKVMNKPQSAAKSKLHLGYFNLGSGRLTDFSD
jgi:hypothetical protein